MAQVNYILLSFLFFFISSSFGETISFEELSKKLIKNNLSIKMSKKYFEISKEDYNIEKAKFFPNIGISIYTEYMKDFMNYPTYIGGQYYVGATGYNTSISLYFDYLIFDFGNKDKRLKKIKKRIKIDKFNIKLEIKEQLLKLLNFYYEGLINQYKLKTLEKLKKIYIHMYNLNKDLYKKGFINRESYLQVGIKIAEISSEIENIKKQQKKLIKNLEFLIGEKLKNPYFSNLKIKKGNYNININKLPEIKIYDYKIAEKKLEIEIIKTNNLPKVYISSKYNLANFDKENYIKTIYNINPIDWRIGLNINIPLFNTHKSRYLIYKVNKEIDLLKLEKEYIKKKKKVELYNDITEFEYTSYILEKEKKNLNLKLNILNDKIKLYKIGKETKLEILRNKAQILEKLLYLKLLKLKNNHLCYKFYLLRGIMW